MGHWLEGGGSRPSGIQSKRVALYGHLPIYARTFGRFRGSVVIPARRVTDYRPCRATAVLRAYETKMIPLLALAQDVQDFMESRNWRFCIIGGIAVQRWGQPRVTTDVDITLFTGFFEEAPYIDEVLKNYKPRREDAAQFALSRRVLLVSGNEIGIDISLGAIPFEDFAIQRATYHSYTPDISLKTCSAEDLVVFKAFADRTKDWADVESVVTRQSDLEWDYIFEQLNPLVELKEAPEILDRLIGVKSKFYRP